MRGVRHLRAQDDAFLLSVVADIDGVSGGPGDLGARLDPRRAGFVAVELAGAGRRHRVENAVIGAAAAQMSRQRRADFLARRRRRSLVLAP